MSSNNKKKTNGQKTTNQNQNNSKEEVKQEVKTEKIKEQETAKAENAKVENVKTETQKTNKVDRKIALPSADKMKVIAISALKVVLPVAAVIVVIAVIISIVNNVNKKDGKAAESAAVAAETSETSAVVLPEEPLQENAYPEINNLMSTFYQALANGDVETIKSIKDYTDETELITFEKKSEFIENYENIVCYTKDGIEDNTYYVYVSYDVKFVDIETTAPGLNTWYVYTNNDGALQIDGDMDETVTATLKLVTNQDDVVDLFNKVDVKYNEAIASDEALSSFLAELPDRIKTSVGVALAQMEAETNAAEQEISENAETVTEGETETVAAEQTELTMTQTVNQQVKTTDTVNVRSSDSEEADKIGKAQKGEILTRVEEKINGWSKVIFDGKEAYIKSDYLEVVSSEAVGEAVGTVKAKTNVNVRNSSSQDADRIGVAQEGNSYNVLEDQGEWLKIDYNGQTGYVKSEYFE